MKKLLLVVSIAFLIFSCNNEPMGTKSTGQEPERIYRIIYHGEGHTSGEIVNERLFAEGEGVTLSMNFFQKEGYGWDGWEVKNAARLEPPAHYNAVTGKWFSLNGEGAIFGKNDIDVYVIWGERQGGTSISIKPPYFKNNLSINE
jgi:hypothetical protein